MKACDCLMIIIVVTLSLGLGVSAHAAEISPQWQWDHPENQDVRCIAMNPSGSTLAVGTDASSDDIAAFAVFKEQSPWPVILEDYDEIISGVDVSDDGQFIAVASATQVRVYHVDTGLVWSYENDGFFWHVDFDSANQYLAVSTRYQPQWQGGQVYCFDAANGDLLWSDDIEAHLGGINPRVVGVQISDDGEKILVLSTGAATGDPAFALLYKTGSATPEIPEWMVGPIEPNWGTEGDYAADGSRFVFTTAEVVNAYNMDPQEIWTFEGIGVPSWVHRVAISDDGAVVAHIGSHSDEWGEGGIEIINGSDGSLIWNDSTTFQFGTVDVSPDGRRVAFSGDLVDILLDPSVYLYDISSNSVIFSYPIIGNVVLDQTGDALFCGAGSYRSTYHQDPPAYFKIQDNAAPVCKITEPMEGAVVNGAFTIRGTAMDNETGIEKVEVLAFDGVYLAEPTGADLSQWQLTVDGSMFTPGDYTIKARAVDNQFKYGQWDTILVSIFSPYPGTPTPTPIPGSRGSLNLILSKTIFHPDDLFRLNAMISNQYVAVADAPLVVALEVADVYYFWPSWQRLNPDGSGFDYALRDIPSGNSSFEIIPQFIWPHHSGTLLGLIFYGAVLTPDFEGLMTNIDFIAWGYSDSGL